MELYNVLNGLTWKLSQSLSALISRYGVAQAIAFGAGTPAIALDDFFYYCITKGSKHIRAALLLIENDLPEDAIVLSRAAYECYICAAYARTQGVKAMDELVYNPIGLGAGTVEYARTKKGGRDYRRLIDKETETNYDAAPSIERMASGTGNSDDAIVHRYYYGFASQHAHVDMSGSGNYRNGANYTDQGSAQSPNAIFLLAYVTIILVGIATSGTAMDEIEKSEIEEDIEAAVIQVHDVLSAHRSELTADFVAAVTARLDCAK